jgi:hypothetical protein
MPTQRIGHSLVDPAEGYETVYNRWYEDDHFYVGVASGPWCFAARRWVAPGQLRKLRVPLAADPGTPSGEGCYASLYWVLDGHLSDFARWVHEIMGQVLMPAGRGFIHRTDVYTGWHSFSFGVRRDEGPMRPEHVLSHPYRGLVVTVVDARDASNREPLHAWLEHEFVPAKLRGSPIGQCVAMVPQPTPEGIVRAPGIRSLEGMDTRTCLLWFLEEDPAASWSALFAPLAAEIHSFRDTHVVYVGPFVPTIPGTHHYVNSLRDG